MGPIKTVVTITDLNSACEVVKSSFVEEGYLDQYSEQQQPSAANQQTFQHNTVGHVATTSIYPLGPSAIVILACSETPLGIKLGCQLAVVLPIALPVLRAR
eukprot:Filipodium_phascolosomae@DN1386_c0_g1_i3.p2